jgi:superfamily I DNA/RNA helicase
MQEKPQPYTSIVVDETQDFGPQALRMLRAMVPNNPNDLFFVGDGHQRIYNRHRASMSACGIDIRGRSRKLYLNYRTTEEIRRQAVAVLEGIEVDDLDEGSDEVNRYKSLSHGPAPKTLHFPHMEEALACLPSLVQESVAGDRSVCVIVPKKHEASAVYDRCKAASLAATIIGPDERDKSDSKNVRIATMHRAKGLEFDEVVLFLPRAWGQSPKDEDDSRKLTYVAMTRAKRLVTTIRY